MSQNLPAWLTVVSPIVGAVGVAFTYERWIIDQRMQQKTDIIDDLTRRIARQEAHHAKERDALLEKAEKAFDALRETLKSINSEEVGAADIVRIKRVLSNCERWENQREAIENCRVAAKELETHYSRFLTKACANALKVYANSSAEFSKLRSSAKSKKSKKFRHDLVNYIGWIYDCLYIGHPNNNPLSNYVKQPTFTSTLPYLIAIEEIKQAAQWKTLSVEQLSYLNDMFDELISRINEEFQA